jgi:hypothetical protein
MSTEETSGPTDEPAPPAEPVLSADEEWKSHVRAENEALEKQFGEHPEPATSAEQTAFPKPDFAMLVGTFSTQAMVALGMLPNPMTGKLEPQLDLARYLIDLLDLMEHKTKGNLNRAEQLFLDDTLHQLRMAYVELKKRPAEPAG